MALWMASLSSRKLDEVERVKVRQIFGWMPYMKTLMEMRSGGLIFAMGKKSEKSGVEGCCRVVGGLRETFYKKSVFLGGDG